MAQAGVALSGCIWLNNLFVQSPPWIMPLVIAGFPLFCPWPPLLWRDYYCNINTKCHHYADMPHHKSMLPRLPGLAPISPIRGFFTLIRPQWIISPSQIPACSPYLMTPPATQAHMSVIIRFMSMLKTKRFIYQQIKYNNFLFKCGPRRKIVRRIFRGSMSWPSRSARRVSQEQNK